MGTIRTLAGLALAATLAFTLAPARAQSQSAGAPLSLLPPAAKVKSHSDRHAAPRVTAVRKPVQRAKSRVALAPRTGAPVLTTGLVMRGGDSTGLIARLPWWRNDTVSYAEIVVSQVLTAADAWIGASSPAGSAFASAQFAVAGGSAVVEPGNLNVLDSVAPALPADRSWLYGLLAVLAGGLAAAATARFLFV